MSVAGLKGCVEIAKANNRHNVLPQLGLSVLLLILTPVIFGITSLDETASAVPLEMFVSLIGIVLFTPVFVPEQSEEIRDTVESKYVSPFTVCLIRTLTAAAVTAVLIAVFVIVMSLSGCDVSLQMAYGTFASAMMLGAIGFTAYGVSGNIAVGYMLPVLYYAMNLTGGDKYLGNFTLFSMMKGSYGEKGWLMGCAVLLLALTMAWRWIVRRMR